MGLSERDQKLIALLPSIGGFISVFFCIKLIVTVLRSAYFRSRVYQRLMAACAFNVIIQSFASIWGPFAVPAGTPGFPYARGTIATCSARGFMAVLISVVPNYFVAIYILAYLGVKSKFNAQKNQWVEKWIHLIVYALPIWRGVYLLSVDAFNPVTRVCSVASTPLGCGDKFRGTPDYKPCERGPENIALLQWYFVALPAVVTMILPTLLVLVMYCRLRHEAVAASVLKQSAFFFFVGIYWTFFFTATSYALLFAKGQILPVMSLLATLIQSLQGVWVYILYWYFRSNDPIKSQEQQEDDVCEEKTSQSENRKSSFPRVSGLFGGLRPEFSIFDGTSVESSESPWAKYLVDEGEDDSYQDGYEYEDTDYEYGGMGESNSGFDATPSDPKHQLTDRTLDIVSDDYTTNTR